MGITHASLFSGIGGGELAAAWMGWRNVFHVEINPFGRKVLEYWFPESISYEDITKTDFTPWRGRVTVLTGGFPCQPFSLAGKRKGAEDDRYLWPQMLRAIREIQPAWVVGENVAGLTTMVQPGKETDMGRSDSFFGESHIYRTEQHFTLADIIQSLEDIGYAVQPFLIPACAVGAPHRRDRLWIVAHAVNAGIRTSGNGREREGQAQPREGQDRPLDRIGRPCDKRPAAHAQCDRSDKIHENNKSTFANGNEPNCKGGKRPATITPCGGDTPQPQTSRLERSRRSDIPQPGEWGEQAKRTDGLVGVERPVEHTASKRLERCKQQEWIRDFAETNSGHGEIHKPDWQGFPSVSPVCRGNDGLPFDLARLTIPEPQWRKESIKAMGNAFVPQVIYEIFRAIQKEYEYITNQNIDNNE